MAGKALPILTATAGTALLFGVSMYFLTVPLAKQTDKIPLHIRQLSAMCFEVAFGTIVGFTFVLFFSFFFSAPCGVSWFSEAVKTCEKGLFICARTIANLLLPTRNRLFSVIFSCILALSLSILLLPVYGRSDTISVSLGVIGIFVYPLCFIVGRSHMSSSTFGRRGAEQAALAEVNMLFSSELEPSSSSGGAGAGAGASAGTGAGSGGDSASAAASNIPQAPEPSAAEIVIEERKILLLSCMLAASGLFFSAGRFFQFFDQISIAAILLILACLCLFASIFFCFSLWHLKRARTYRNL